jgi:transposase
MAEHRRIVYAGVDTHQEVHVAAVIDADGRLLATRQFPTSPLGLRRLASWLQRHGRVAKAGVEGTGSYGLALQRVLQARGIEVVEVNRPNRQLRRSRGKSDTVDAEAAARAVLAGHAAVVPKSRDGIVESIRVLRVALESSRRSRQRIGQQLHHLALTAPEPLRVDLAGLGPDALADRAARLRPGGDAADPATATSAGPRILGRQHRALTADLAELRQQLDVLTERANPALRQAHGVGPDTAAALLVAAGDNPQRLSGEAAFAALCGASPVEASSGKTTGHRLNRGGDRQANAALYRIVLVRMSNHRPTRDYVARRTAQGKSKRAIIRCLKRYVAREVHHLLLHPEPVATADALRSRRTALGLTQRAVADAVGAHAMAISRLERGLSHDRGLILRYHTWIGQLEAS